MSVPENSKEWWEKRSAQEMQSERDFRQGFEAGKRAAKEDDEGGKKVMFWSGLIAALAACGLCLKYGHDWGFERAVETRGEREAERVLRAAEWKETQKKYARSRVAEAKQELESARRALAEADPYSVDSIDLFSPAFYELEREDRESILRAALEGLAK